ncbi:hypothetical protein GCM10009599_00070 [Luteococcus peritonei]
MDPTVRDVASLGLACDMAEGVEVRHDLVQTDQGQVVRCTVADLGGVVHREDVELDHGCLSCTVREGLVPTLRWIAAQQRWRQVLVTLPTTGAPDAVAHQVQQALDDGELDALRLAHVLTVVDQARLVHDLLGDDLLAERGLELSEQDVRAVGEALANQLDYCDTVLTLDDADPVALALLEHALVPGVDLVQGIGSLDVAAVFASRHQVERNQQRMAPTRRRARTRQERHGVWTVELHSPRAFHPGRLLEQIELLGIGEVRARGCFHLPSRPGVVCIWDGSGGQLSIGEAGLWQERTPFTRLVVSGIDEQVRDRIARAFHDVLLTEHEQRVSSRWAGRPDGLEPWLGEVELPWAG